MRPAVLRGGPHLFIGLLFVSWGVLQLLDTLGLMEFRNSFRTYWPVVLVAWGGWNLLTGHVVERFFGVAGWIRGPRAGRARHGRHFATAYDEYALKAFDVHAVDYLLKPFSRERLHEAIERARQRLANGERTSTSASELSAAGRPAGVRLSRIVIRDGADVHVVPIDRVDYIEAQDDYIAVHTGGRTLLKDQTMTTLEAHLDPRRFVRIHRSFLLNLDRLARLETTGKDTRTAVLRDGRELPVSRTGYARLQALL